MKHSQLHFKYIMAQIQRYGLLCESEAIDRFSKSLDKKLRSRKKKSGLPHKGTVNIN